MAEVQAGGAAGEPWRGAGAGGRVALPGRRTVGNWSERPTSNFMEGAPGIDIPALLSPGRRRTPGERWWLNWGFSFLLVLELVHQVHSDVHVSFAVKIQI